MKKLTNKEFKLTLTEVIQDPITQTITRTTSSTSVTLTQILEPQIRTNDGKGFDDLKIMKERLAAITILENRKAEEEFEVEDAIFTTLSECGKKFKPGFISEEMIRLKEYLDLMVCNPEKFNV